MVNHFGTHPLNYLHLIKCKKLKANETYFQFKKIPSYYTMSVMTLSTETNHQLRENNNDVCPICANSDSKMASPTLLFRERRSSPGSSTLTEGTTRSYRAEVSKALLFKYLNKKKQIQTGLN